ncbi:hypothetical protein [Halarchaeum salinum]|uniref:C2H2-type domain-containing protein n=1 Tax=Halarchaeum salinum TaxID=489912 RepID=A0AAV3S901_9EURY
MTETNRAGQEPRTDGNDSGSNKRAASGSGPDVVRLRCRACEIEFADWAAFEAHECGDDDGDDLDGSGGRRVVADGGKRENYGTRGSEFAAKSAKKSGTCSRHPCPKCGEMFGQLALHLRACDGGAE